MSSATSVMLGRRYRLDERIAVGGYGEVWRGTDVMLNRPVAVKLLLAAHVQHPQILARFRAEARHAAGLTHGNIARVYDYAESEPPHPPYLVMEFVDGPSLAGLMPAGPMEPAKVMDVVAQAASGLHAAHQAGLVHRDVKPGNLLLSQGSIVKITDFGISYAVGSTPVTTAGSLMGTPGYIAPERLNGIAASPASDLYSLGIVAYECLMGAAPFAGVALEVALAHRDRPIPPLPVSVPSDVAALVSELTAKEAAQRPGNAGEVAGRAAEIRDRLGGGLIGPDLAAEPVVSPAPTVPDGAIGYPADICRAGSTAGQPPRRPGRGGRRPGGPAVVAAGIVMAALLGLVLANVVRPGSSPSPAAAAMPPIPSASSSHKPATSSSHKPATVTMAQVNVGSMIGQPVGLVVSRLRHLDLDVRVLWRVSDRQPPGRVLSVQPGGRIAPDTLVTVLGTVAPPPSRAAAPPAHPKPAHDKGGHHGGRPGKRHGHH